VQQGERNQEESDFASGEKKGCNKASGIRCEWGEKRVQQGERNQEESDFASGEKKGCNKASGIRRRTISRAG